MQNAQETDGVRPTRQGILVIAHSGRVLAQAIRQTGHSPLVIDLFADQDTQKIAEQLWQAENLSLTVVKEIVEQLLSSYKIKWVIYGSGMENQPETLDYLAGMFTVTGNSSAVCKQLSDKKNFFKQLDTLDICYPEVSFHPPEKTSRWLIKPNRHVGGVGIVKCDRVASENEYYQKFCQGIAGSVLFCADGQQVELIGFHRQWTCKDSFIFSGMIQQCLLPEDEQKRIHDWLEKLVNCYHFQGLGSLDFIWNGEKCYFLEINPRPPASMQLYSELDLIAAHITGRLLGKKNEKTVRALQIVYARQPCHIKQNIQWPAWSFDKPGISTRIKTGSPICTITAQEDTVQQTLDSLLEKLNTIENILY